MPPPLRALLFVPAYPFAPFLSSPSLLPISAAVLELQSQKRERKERGRGKGTLAQGQRKRAKERGKQHAQGLRGQMEGVKHCIPKS
eukprot:3941626-Rhodomonas_salina.2